MELSLDMLEDRQSRVVAAAEIVSFALERDLPHMALGAAREAARSALLALAAAPRGRLSGPDLELLREMAAAPPQHFAGRPAERAATIRAMLSVLDRLFPRPPAAAGHGPPWGGAAEQPARRSPERGAAWDVLWRRMEADGSGDGLEGPAWGGRGSRRRGGAP